MGISTETAQQILGLNFHGMEEVRRCFAINPPPFPHLETVPWSEEDLLKHRRRDVVFLGAHLGRDGKLLTINTFLQQFPATAQPHFFSFTFPEENPYYWFTKEQFAQERACEWRWYRMRKSLSEHSRCQPFYSWRRCLLPGESLGFAVVYIYGAFLHFLATGEYLYEKEYFWCGDILSDGLVVTAGRFNRHGWTIICAPFYERSEELGLVPIILPED